MHAIRLLKDVRLKGVLVRANSVIVLPHKGVANQYVARGQAEHVA